MNITAVSLVRDEADIILPFLDWTSRFVDRHVVIDHNSIDGTWELTESFRESRPPGAVRHVTYPFRGWRQDQIMTGVVRGLLAHSDEWFLLLDADEFLDFPSRPALELALASCDDGHGMLKWINLGPTHMASSGPLVPTQRFLTAPDHPTWPKVVVHSSWLQAHPSAWIDQGYHSVRERHWAEALVGPTIGGLLHMPVRSWQHLETKLARGVAAYGELSGRGSQGAHFHHMLQRLSGGLLNDNTIARVVALYGHDLDPREFDALDPQVFVPRALPAGVAGLASWSTDAAGTGASTPIHTPRSPVADEELGATSIMLVHLTAEPVMEIRPLVLTPRGDEGPREFASLAPTPGLEWASIVDAVPGGISHAAAPSIAIPSSAWAPHAPLLRFLMTVARARRYVELGTHNGMSLLSAVQASRPIDGSQCIGIDTWAGDEHAGTYDEDVFLGFRDRARAVAPDDLLFIRASFNEARILFAPGSIDVLLIDGLHTYEAVKNDFESWLPAMSDRGIMLFHDTHARGHGFGVWRLWDEIRADYPSIDITHSYGLGVAVVGQIDPPLADTLRHMAVPPMPEIIEAWAQAQGAQMMREHALALQLTEATRVHDLLLAERHGVAEEQATLAAQVAELSERVAELDRDRQEYLDTLTAIYGSRSWRMVHRAQRVTRRVKRSTDSKD